jgi:hypothetical protein
MKNLLFDECVVQLLKTWSDNVELRGSSSHTSNLYAWLDYLSRLHLELVFHDDVHNVTNGICEYDHILLIMVKKMHLIWLHVITYAIIKTMFWLVVYSSLTNIKVKCFSLSSLMSKIQSKYYSSRYANLVLLLKNKSTNSL